MHAVGDAAVDRVLDAYELADAERSIRGRRFIVIHGSLMRREQMERARALEVRVDAQTAFLSDKASAVARFLGKKNAVGQSSTPIDVHLPATGAQSLRQASSLPAKTGITGSWRRSSCSFRSS